MNSHKINNNINTLIIWQKKCRIIERWNSYNFSYEQKQTV